MKVLSDGSIQLENELTELDKFVLDFISILKKHCRYVIISGYVSILLGRSRATEDIDLFIEHLSTATFNNLYAELKPHGYWCLNAEDAEEIYSYLTDNLAIRFAKKPMTIPNFEIKIARKPLSLESLNSPIKVLTKGGEILISSLEQQVAYKRYYLKSDKDLEDAAHIENLFKKHLKYGEIERYKRILEHEMA